MFLIFKEPATCGCSPVANTWIASSQVPRNDEVHPATNRNRTGGLSLTRGSLYQLSYSGLEGKVRNRSMTWPCVYSMSLQNQAYIKKDGSSRQVHVVHAIPLETFFLAGRRILQVPLHKAVEVGTSPTTEEVRSYA